MLKNPSHLIDSKVISSDPTKNCSKNVCWSFNSNFRTSLDLLLSHNPSERHTDSTRSLHSTWWNLNVSQPSSGTYIVYSNLRNSLCWVSCSCILCSLIFSLRFKEHKISGALSMYMYRICTSSLVLCLKNSSHLSLPKLWFFGLHFS